MNEKELKQEIKWGLNILKCEISLLNNHIAYLEAHLKIVNLSKNSAEREKKLSLVLKRITDTLPVQNAIDKYAKKHAKPLD